MKQKLLLICIALLCAVGSWAQTDVTASFVGDLSHIINGGGHHCSNTHKLSNATYGYGDGWWNTQDISANAWHSFTAPGGEGTGESWTSSFAGAGVMMGRTMVLPAGNYTLSFKAFGCNASNSVDPSTMPNAGDAVAFLTGADNVDITNIESAGDDTFHDVSFTFNVTADNSTYEFGIKKLTNDSKIDWCQIKEVSLVLNSTNRSYIANNSTDGWSDGVAVNSGSVEGCNDNTKYLPPFIQVHVGSGSTLANGTYQKSFTPDQNGFYRVNAWVRLFKESSGQSTYSGASMFAGANSVSVCSGGALYNSNKAYLGTYSAKIDATKDVAFNYGFTLSSANFNWLAFKNITIEKITMDEFAETFSSGSTVTANTWYKFTTGSGEDAYTLSSNGDATITYTTDGTLADDNDITTTWTLHAKRNAVLAPNTTYYIKSSAAVTLTTNASSVNSSYVSGWTKVTSISDLQDSPEDYFFAIFSANNTGLILGASSSYSEDANVKQRLHYKTAADPLSSSAYLFEIENYDDQFVLKSCAIDKYFNNTSDQPWNYHANATSTTEDCKTTVTLANGVYTLQAANGGSNNYLGLWWQDSTNEGYKDGEYLAGNKGEIAKGSFLIYRIAKNNLSLTSRMSNDVANWTGVGRKTAKQPHNTGVETYDGDEVQFNTGNVLTQTINNLPNGNYKIQFYAFENFAKWQSYEGTYGDGVAQAFANTTSKNLNVILSKTNDEWDAKNLQTLHVLVTNGSLTYGIKNIAAGGNWASCKAVSLTYLGEEVADGLDLTGLILNPTFANVGSAGENTGWIGEGRTVESKEDWTGTARNVMAQNGNNYNRKQSVTFPYAGTYRLDIYGLTKENGEFGAKIADSDGTNILTLSTQVYNASTKHYTVGTDGVETSTLNSDGDKWTIEHIYFDIPSSSTEKYIHLHSNYSNPNHLAYIGAVKLTYVGKTAENKDFALGAVSDGAKIATYPHDAGEGDVFGTQYVPGWTATNNVESVAAGVINVNTSTKLGSTTVPSAGYINSNDKLLGLLAVWSGTVQYRKSVTLPSGTYSLCVPIYNAAGTTDFSTNLFGFVESNGTTHYASATTYSVGEWTLETIDFTLASETIGYISLGYTAANTGGDNMPKLFVDRVVLAPALALYEDDTYTPEAGTYNVTLDRTFNSNWATFVVPFDIDNATLTDRFGDDVRVSEFSADDKTGVTFTPMLEPAISANKPVLMKTSTDASRFTFDGVTIEEGTPTVSQAGVNFVGNYGGDIELPNELDTYYVKSNEIWKATGDQRLKGFRAYFTVDADSPVKAFFENGFNFDDADAISDVKSKMEETRYEIYNLAGQRLSKAQRGLNIINGKKVLVK